jgi:hypothetical protein
VHFFISSAQRTNQQLLSAASKKGSPLRREQEKKQKRVDGANLNGCLWVSKCAARCKQTHAHTTFIFILSLRFSCGPQMLVDIQDDSWWMIVKSLTHSHSQGKGKAAMRREETCARISLSTAGEATSGTPLRVKLHAARIYSTLCCMGATLNMQFFSAAASTCVVRNVYVHGDFFFSRRATLFAAARN